MIDFFPSVRHCPGCSGELRVQKTKTRSLATLATGTLLAREVRLQCPRCPAPPLLSQQLAELAPPGQRFGYDLIVWVGLQRYHHMRQRREIAADLAARGIAVSTGSLSAICDRFLLLLQALHRHRAPALRAAMPHGYPLHLDATCDKGRGGLFLCLDGWRRWVLHAVRIRSENAAEMRPAIETTLAVFGQPVACMRDLGSAIAKAVASCLQPGSAELVCHFHFLAAVGRKLLDADHSALNRALTQLRIRSGLRSLLRPLRAQARQPAADARQVDLPALLLWTLQGDGRKQPPYPFSLSHWELYQRCRQFDELARRRLPRPRSQLEQGTLEQVRDLLEPLSWDNLGLPAIAARIQTRQALFGELRSILRLRHDELRGRKPGPPPSPSESVALLESVASRVTRFRGQLRQRMQQADKAGTSAESVVLRYLDRYRDQLFGHPVAHDESGRPVAVVERTNNPAEHFFAGGKRRLRRRLGHANLGRAMQDQPAQAALTANLLDPQYVQILCGTLEDLPRAFAELATSDVDWSAAALDRPRPDSQLQRRIRAWETDAKSPPSVPPASALETAQKSSTPVSPTEN